MPPQVKSPAESLDGYTVHRGGRPIPRHGSDVYHACRHADDHAVLRDDRHQGIRAAPSHIGSFSFLVAQRETSS